MTVCAAEKCSLPTHRTGYGDGSVRGSSETPGHSGETPTTHRQNVGQQKEKGRDYR